MKTVLITGCSSGYGLATAHYFDAQGWNVIATMRQPMRDLFPASKGVRVLPLDVTKQESIAQALRTAGQIDVLVNNAGIGLFGAAEATPMATVREVFETNTFGVLAMCQAVIPKFKERGWGTIINVTSNSMFAPMPLVAAYAASKTAIEGFTLSLDQELKAFKLRVKVVQPGYGPYTSFTSNGQQRMQGLIPKQYELLAHRVFASLTHARVVTNANDVAEAVWSAANDTSDQVHFPAGADSVRPLQLICWRKQK